MKKIVKRTLIGTALVGVLATGFSTSEYMDLPMWLGKSEKTEMGRTKNSIAAVIGGIVGQKLYGDSNIDLEIKKTLFPDAKVTGSTGARYIDTKVDLATTSSHFYGNNNPLFEGTVDKSEFDWKVKQISENVYEIARFGPKFDGKLEIEVQNGKISGTFVRGLAFDWKINGKYSPEGKVTCDVSCPMGLGITLEGKITKK